MRSLHRARVPATPSKAAQRACRTYRVIIRSSIAPTTTAAIVKRTHYQLLGVKPTACAEDIRTAFRRLAKSLHPDHNKLPGAREKFQEVKEAYDILLDVTSRTLYDRELKIQAMAAAAAAAQTTSGGRRASTIGLRRSRVSGSVKSQASGRPSSGDDFDVFSDANASPLGASGHGFDDTSYTSIFDDNARASSTTASAGVSTSSGSRSDSTYRSVFGGPPKPATAPRPQTPPMWRASSASTTSGAAAAARSASRFTSSQTGAAPPAPGSGYKSIFGENPSASSDSWSSPTTSSSSSNSNPCIFNGRSISPNLGVMTQMANVAVVGETEKPLSPGRVSMSTGPPTSSYVPSHPAAAQASNSDTSTHLNATAGAPITSFGASNITSSSNVGIPSADIAPSVLRQRPSITYMPNAARTPFRPPATAPAAAAAIAPDTIRDTNSRPQPIISAATAASPSLPAAASGAGSSPTGHGTNAPPGGFDLAKAATSFGSSMSDVASRLAVMASAAVAGTSRSRSNMRSSSGGSGDVHGYVSLFGGSGRPASPRRSDTGFQVTVEPSVTAGNSTAASRPPVGSIFRDQPQPQQSPLLQKQHVTAPITVRPMIEDKQRLTPQVAPAAPASAQSSPPVPTAAEETAAAMADAEAAARVAVAMAEAAAKAKVAADAAEAVAVEAAAVASRAKAAAMVAEARLSAVVEATGAAGSPVLPKIVNPTATATPVDL